MDGAYGKLVLRSFSFFFSADFSSHSFLKNAWERLVYEKNQGAECHGNDRTKLQQMQVDCQMVPCHCLIQCGIMTILSFFSRGHTTLHLAVWVGPSVPP